MKQFKNFFKLYIFIVLFITSCMPDPEASFTYNLNSDEYPAQVDFTNQSMNADNYYWEFGDGETSTSPSPTHYYHNWGEMYVSLTVGNSKSTDTQSKIINIPRPTTYAIKNETGITLYEAISFYYDGNDIYDVVTHGTIRDNEVSAEYLTKRNKIYISFDLANGKSYLVDNYYIIYQHKKNELTVTGSTKIIELKGAGNGNYITKEHLINKTLPKKR